MTKHRTSTGAMPLTRRRLLGTAASISSVGVAPLIASSGTGAAEAPEIPRVLPERARAVLAAFADRIVPVDDNGPGALEAGVPDYIERSLAEWNQAESPELQAGLDALDAHALERHGAPFAELDSAVRDEILTTMESGPDPFEGAQTLFNRLHRLTLEGMFSDPYHGGNRRYIGWDLIGYPGAVMASTPDMQRMGERLPPLHTSAYGANFDGD